MSVEAAPAWTESAPEAPYRATFLCPRIRGAQPALDPGSRAHELAAELVIQACAEAFSRNPAVAIIPPERFPAYSEDGVAMDFDACADGDGFAERFIHARCRELLWLELDYDEGAASLFGFVFGAEPTLIARALANSLGEAITETLNKWLECRKLPGTCSSLALIAAETTANIAAIERLIEALDAHDSGPALMELISDEPLALSRVRIALRKAKAELPAELVRRTTPTPSVLGYDDPLALAYDAFIRAPDEPSVLVTLAALLLDAGRATEAYRMADRASRIVPSDAQAQLTAGRAGAAVGRVGEAWNDVDLRLSTLEECSAAGELVELDPADALVALREQLAAEYERAGVRTALDAGDLVTAYRVSEGFTGKPWLALMRAETALHLGDLASGWLLARHALAVAPQAAWDLEYARLMQLCCAFPIDALDELLRAAKDDPLAPALARDVADFHPHAGASAELTALLGSAAPLPFSDTWLDPLRDAIGAERTQTLDRIFVVQSRNDAQEAGRLVLTWHGLIERFASEHGVPNPQNPDLAPTLMYVTAQALCRYAAATTRTPSPLAGAYRQIVLESCAAARMADSDTDDLVPFARAIGGLLAALGSERPEHLTTLLGVIERAYEIELRSGAQLRSLMAGQATDHESRVAHDALAGDEAYALRYCAAVTGRQPFLPLARATGDLGLYERAVAASEPGAEAALELLRAPLSIAERWAVKPVELPFDVETARRRAELASSEPDVAFEKAKLWVKQEPASFAAWRALLTAAQALRPLSELPVDALKTARTLLQISAGDNGFAAVSARIAASRVVELCCFALDRLPLVADPLT